MAETISKPETIEPKNTGRELPPPPEIEAVLAPAESETAASTKDQGAKEKIGEILADLKKVMPVERQKMANPSFAVREQLGELFYKQYLAIRETRLSEIMTSAESTEETSAWGKIKKGFGELFGKKKEEEKPSAEKQLALNKLGVIYASIKSPVDAYSALNMTVEQFLIKYLKNES